MVCIGIKVITTGVSEIIESDFTIVPENNIRILNFESDNFIFRMFIKDAIEFDELLSILSGSGKKIELMCTLKKGDKQYNGNRKIVLKNEVMAVSQGGARFEFNRAAMARLREILSQIRAR